MMWVNPHAWIYVDVKKPDGTVEEWMIEAGTPNTLLRRGFTKESLHDGHRDHGRRVSVEGRIAPRQRPRSDAAQRPDAVPRLVGHRRARTKRSRGGSAKRRARQARQRAWRRFTTAFADDDERAVGGECHALTLWLVEIGQVHDMRRAPVPSHQFLRVMEGHRTIGAQHDPVALW